MESQDNPNHPDIETCDEKTGNHRNLCFQETENQTKLPNIPYLKKIERSFYFSRCRQTLHSTIEMNLDILRRLQNLKKKIKSNQIKFVLNLLRMQNKIEIFWTSQNILNLPYCAGYNSSSKRQRSKSEPKRPSIKTVLL